MKVLDLIGFVDIYYVAPNSWENVITQDLQISFIYPEVDFWKVINLGTIRHMECRRFHTTDFPEVFQNTSLGVFHISRRAIPNKLSELPIESLWVSDYPQWRNTSGFQNSHAQVSYQSEIFPLPSKGTMLSFHPFIQYGKLSNFLVVANLLKTPQQATHELTIFDSKSFKKIGEAELKSNGVTAVNLDQFKIPSDSLPVMKCSTMAGIPFGLGISEDNKLLSLEHTHPPASLTIFGNRFGFQNEIKKRWFERLI